VAVLDSSCNRETGGRRERGRRDGQESRYQERKNGQECKCAVRTGDSYVNSQGNTFVTRDHSEACMV
jgi:hypothetical protein